MNSNLISCPFVPFILSFENFAVKNILSCLFFFVLFPFSSIYTNCQEGNLSEIIVSIAEELAEDEASQEVVATYIERLHELNENPVNLNSADENSLSRLFFLTDFQIKALADYIHSTGKIFSVYEIANVPGFDNELARHIVPFVSIKSNDYHTSDSITAKNTLITNFSTKFNKEEGQLGPAHKILLKYKFNGNGITAGITSEKDSGERYFSGNHSEPDFISAYFAWNGRGIIKKVIVGDFSGRFGMGTAINTGLRTGLSITSPGCLSGSDEIKPYTSTDENNFFRGMAVKLLYKRISVDLFYSSNKIDATLKTSDGHNVDRISSLYTAGLHNSSILLSKKDAVTEKTYGINLGLDFRNFRTGFLWSGSAFTIPIEPDKSDPANLYDFEGSSIKTGTGYYRATYGKMIFFGEISVGYNLHTAVVQGITVRPDDRLNLNILYRRYEPGFRSFHGRAPFSSFSGDNTKGIYANFSFEAVKNLFISGGCDIRHYPWLKYRCSAPSLSVAKELKFRYLPSDNTVLEAIYSSRSSMLDDPGSEGLKKQTTTRSRSIRGLFKYTPESYLTLTTRIAYKSIKPSGSSGMMLLQDICFKFRNVPLSIWIRYCLFRTDNWDSRLYVYENDLLYNLSIPALSGEGCRSYFMADWRFCRSGEFRIKYALTEFEGVTSSDATGNDLKFQIRLWF